MFDDSDKNQKNENQMNGVDNVASSGSGLGTGAISDPTHGSSDSSQSSTDSPSAAPQQDTSSPSSDNYGSSAPSLGGNNGTSENNNNLDKIKHQALEQLSPLVNKLDQTPEEKYKTIMMMIQASDNQALISEAYEAAQKITDEKLKAEALLNIVNEISYFTQNNQ